MGIKNHSFETGAGGQADLWIHSTYGTVEDYAEFAQTIHDVGIESFEEWWGAPIEVILAFSGFYEDLDPAIFCSALLLRPYECFEIGWNTVLLATLTFGQYAAFDSGTEDFEDFEDGWGDFDLTPTQVLAVFDVGTGTPESFEDFEDGWTAGTQELKTEFTGGDLSTASFDLGSNDYESFEDASWPAL